MGAKNPKPCRYCGRADPATRACTYCGRIEPYAVLTESGPRLLCAECLATWERGDRSRRILEEAFPLE